jgi:hypothetical protein
MSHLFKSSDKHVPAARQCGNLARPLKIENAFRGI